MFVKDAVCQAFVEALLHYRNEGAYRLHAFVLMPEHFHILLTPGERTPLERAIMYVKGGSARKIGEMLNAKLPVWQRGFSDHRVRDTGDYQVRLGYLELNPVKRGLAATPGDYIWSSASRRYPLDDAPLGLKPPAQRLGIGTAEAVP